MKAETTVELESVLRLEGDMAKLLVQEQPTDSNKGVMKVKVPFYVSESITKAPGIAKKIHFPGAVLPGLIQEGKRQISERKQPLNVYARHAHAMAQDHLPIGAVVDLEQDGRVGYATIEISPTDGPSGGKNVQTLIQSGHLNGVSLRSALGHYKLAGKKVNGEDMLQLQSLQIDGIDFAPDGPAQPTYGVEILQEAASVQDESTKPSKEESKKVSLTLEELRTEHPSLVAEIEAPYRREAETAKAERDALLAEKRSAAREAKLREIAAQFPKPEEALPLLLEVCKDCETDDAVAAKAFPILLEAMSLQKKQVENPRTKLIGQFANSGRGQAGLTQEKARDKDEIDPDEVAGIGLAAV